MRQVSVRSTVAWVMLSLLFLSVAVMIGPVPALAETGEEGPPTVAATGADSTVPTAVLYEVTEDMYLLNASGDPAMDLAQAVRRAAVARLAGWASLGSPLCPYEVLSLAPGAKRCDVNATGADDLSLTTGKGTMNGSFTVVVQDANPVDGSEFVVLTGTFSGDADLSPAFAGLAPLGFITNGVGTIDGVGTSFAFSGTFRLPYSLTPDGSPGKPRREKNAYYLGDDGRKIKLKPDERSLGFPTVRIEIRFQ